MRMLYHISEARDWQDAQQTGVYSNSTLGKSYDEVGFIHLSFADQVKAVADAMYRDVPGLFLLRIDPGKLNAEIRVESAAGTTERFPHLYGLLPIGAVSDVGEYNPTSDGSFPAVTE